MKRFRFTRHFLLFCAMGFGLVGVAILEVSAQAQSGMPLPTAMEIVARDCWQRTSLSRMRRARLHLRMKYFRTTSGWTVC